MSSQKNGSRFAAYLPDDWRLLISAFAAAYGIGWLSLLGLPFLIGSAMVSLHLDAAQAGLLVTVEFIGIMLASLAAAPFMGRTDRRLLSLIGAFAALSANGISIIINSYDALVIIRPIAGLGAGLAIACGNATVSNAKNPERFAGQMSMLAVVLMVVIMLTFSRLSELWGLAGVYAGMMAITAMMLPGLIYLPKQNKHSDHALTTTNGTEIEISKVCSILMLVAFFAFSLRDTMAWAFVERIGFEVGYTTEQIGNLLSVQAMLGITGPLIASVLGSRFGMKAPVVVGIVLSGLVTYVISQSSDSQLLYTIATTFQPCTYFFTLAYLTALAAELDIKGRVVAASGSALMAGVAIGPIIGGRLIVDAGGYLLIGWVIFGCVIVTLLASLVPAFSIRPTVRTSRLVNEPTAQ